MLNWFILFLVALVLLVILALFSRIEAISLSRNPEGVRLTPKEYFLGLVVVLEHSLFLVIAFPLVIIRIVKNLCGGGIRLWIISGGLAILIGVSYLLNLWLGW